MNCKIVKDITGCQQLFDGGIADEILLYDLEDTTVDYSSGLEVLRIDGVPTAVKGSTWSYEQGVGSDGSYSHKLSGSILLDAIEELHAAQNQNFIVVFKTKRGEYKLFGDRYGAKLSYEKNIDNSQNIISVTLSASSDAPIKSVDMSNFIPTRVYNIIQTPINYSCQILDGAGTGYKVPSYVVYENFEGRPLDIDGRLCEFTGNKQAAYKLVGQPDLDYNIVGTYLEDEHKVYDIESCDNDITGSISVDKPLIEIDTTNVKSASFAITSDSSWSILNADEIETFKVTPQNGPEGDTDVVVYGGLGGDETLQIINNATNEIVTVEVKSYRVDVAPIVDANGADRLISIPVECNGEFTVDYTESDDYAITVVDNVIYVTLSHTFYEYAQINMTVKHNSFEDEQKLVAVNISAAGSTEPNWVVVKQVCEVE